MLSLESTQDVDVCQQSACLCCMMHANTSVDCFLQSMHLVAGHQVHYDKGLQLCWPGMRYMSHALPCSCLVRQL